MYFLEKGKEIKHVPAFKVNLDEVVDSTGAGDIFHGAYVYSYLKDKTKTWEQHFIFASAASAHSVKSLGIEDSLPTLDDVNAVLAKN